MQKYLIIFGIDVAVMRQRYEVLSMFKRLKQAVVAI